MANTEAFRLVRCPKCLNVLPEPAHVTVYKCGGCGTTLRAKIRASNGQRVATKQVRQDSDDYSIATSVSNGVPPQNKDQASNGVAMDSSCIADTPSARHDSNGARSNENDDVMPAEKIAVQVENESKNSHNFDVQDTNSRMEGHSHNSEGQDTISRMEAPADLILPNSNPTHTDSGEAENHTVEQSAEDSETCRVTEDNDTVDASENNMLPSEESKLVAVSTPDPEQSTPDPEQKGAGEAEHETNKKSYLVRVQSRSCDLRASAISLDFHSARTSLQSKSFRAGEPLQSKIMNTVDELKGDLSELFSKPPSDCKPGTTTYPPPRRPEQDGHMPRVAITASAPLPAYHHPAARHPGPATRLSRSGQVAPLGLPSPPPYRRHRAYSGYRSEQTEMRPCRHECCHSCRPPPCYRSCEQEPATHKPPVKETKRRPPPRHHCRPVLRGAPFVICSSCLKLVQLPTDFAVPSKGTRRLQCGSCAELLSYSYRDPGRKKKLQSPFGGDEYSTDDHEIHHQVADDRSARFQQADPVSYSEEYGLSFGVSYSTSTEDGQPLNVSRNSSFNTVDEMTGKDGKLHRLMGYSSASELLRHSPDLFESFEHRRTPAARTDDRKGKGVCVAEGDSDERGGAAKRSKARSAGLPLPGLLRRGIHGLESLKLRS